VHLVGFYYKNISRRTVSWTSNLVHSQFDCLTQLLAWEYIFYGIFFFFWEVCCSVLRLAGSFEMLVPWHYMLQDHGLNTHSCENIQSQMQITVYKWGESNCQYLCAWRHFWNTFKSSTCGPPLFPVSHCR
jgi:hypothetical protein